MDVSFACEAAAVAIRLLCMYMLKGSVCRYFCSCGVLSWLQRVPVEAVPPSAPDGAAAAAADAPNDVDALWWC